MELSDTKVYEVSSLHKFRGRWTVHLYWTSCFKTNNDETRCSRTEREQLLHRTVQRFRGGLVFKAHRLCVSLNSRLESNKEEKKKGAYEVYHSTLGLRVIKKKEGTERDLADLLLVVGLESPPYPLSGD